MQMALIKDFLVDPFIDPESMIIIYENGKVVIKDQESIDSGIGSEDDEEQGLNFESKQNG